MSDWVDEINKQYDIDPPKDDSEPVNFDVSENDKCPHSNEWAECDACDHASDIAFDAARENRFFR
jgi:hypothetical protein